jgi:hypothetical protein
VTPNRLEAKPVWRGGEILGYARTWGEVAEILGDKHRDAAARLSRENSEGASGFYLKATE